MLAPALLAISAAVATDYRVDSSAWNGLSSLAELATELGCPARAPAALVWEELDPRDVLMLVYPLSSLDPEAVLGFLRTGGRAVIADDFGQAGPLLGRLGITRLDDEIEGAARYQGRARLLLATARGASPLASSTRIIVTNHPASFRSRLEPAFELAPGRAAVIEGQLGRGRFVALSDPSVLINNMLELPENRVFAAALVASLCRPGQDRLVVLSGAFAVRGKPPSSWTDASGGPETSWRERFATLGEELGRAASTGGGRSLLGLVAVALALAWLVRAIPRRAVDDTGTWTRVEFPSQVGYEALVRRYASGELPWGDRLLMAGLREEVLARMGGLLGEALTVEAHPPRRIGELVGARCGKEAGRLAEALWRELWRLAADRRPSPTLSPRRFRRLYRLTSQLFEHLPGPPQRHLS